MSWLDPITATPSIVQVDFGAWGQNVPGYGEAYCGPTSIVMGLYYLYNNGFTQLAPCAYQGPEGPEATNLERVIAGLMRTSVDAGTGNWMYRGVVDYLSACGLSLGQYTTSLTNKPGSRMARVPDRSERRRGPDNDRIGGFLGRLVLGRPANSLERGRPRSSAADRRPFRRQCHDQQLIPGFLRECSEPAVKQSADRWDRGGSAGLDVA
jgi:hypothetical protein